MSQISSDSIVPTTTTRGSEAGESATVSKKTLTHPLPDSETPLASLPLRHLLRSLLLHMVSSSPLLLSLTTRILLKNIDGLSHPFSPLRYLIRKTFYEHFCAGENGKEVRRNREQLEKLGIKGVCLAYPREVEHDGEKSSTFRKENEMENDVHSWREVMQWIDGNLRTIEYSSPGDFIAIKLTGGGEAVNRLLTTEKPSSANKQVDEGIKKMVNSAKDKGVKLAIDAEHVNVQKGIDEWTLELMRKYNANPENKAWVFNTYQMYLKDSPRVLEEHLELARKEGWKLGVKLVRGAYLASDPRDAICESKEVTDKQYDQAVEMLMREKKAGIELMLATHNRESVMKAVEQYSKKGSEKNKKNGGVDDLVVAQLQGMADELSFGLVGRRIGEDETKVYKYVVWGSIPVCVKYLLRRAEENKEAVARSRESVERCLEEVKRRLRIFG